MLIDGVVGFCLESRIFESAVCEWGLGCGRLGVDCLCGKSEYWGLVNLIYSSV